MRGDLEGCILARNPEAAAFQRLVLINLIVSTPAPLDVTEPAVKARASSTAIGQGLERGRVISECASRLSCAVGARRCSNLIQGHAAAPPRFREGGAIRRRGPCGAAPPLTGWPAFCF
jgi:hypothetical protein